MRFREGLFVVLATLFASPALGQSIGAGFDLNVPTCSEDVPGSENGLDFSGGYGLHVGFYPSKQSFVENQLGWGLIFGFQSLSLKPNSLGFKEQRVSAKSLDLVVEKLVFRTGRFYASAGAGAGYVSVSDITKIEPADTFQLSLRGGFEASIRGSLGLLISEKSALVLGIRSWVWSRGRDDTYPFKNGPVFSVGFRVS